MNNLSFLRDQLYALKMSYGFPGAIYRTTIGDTDLTTGKKSITRTKYEIEKAIILPIKYETVQFLSAALLKAARSFAYGGFQDQETKRILLDGDDLAQDFEIQPEDYFVYDHKKFEIVHAEKLEDGLGYQLIVKRLVGAPVNEIHELKVYQSIRFLPKGEVTP